MTIYRFGIVIVMVAAASACSSDGPGRDAGPDDGGGGDGATSDGGADGGLDAGEDSTPDADAGRDGGGPTDGDAPELDGDAPETDGGAPACSNESSQTEITAAPAKVEVPRMAAGPSGLAAVWLDGDGDARDVTAVLLDETLTATTDPVVVATSRPEATAPAIVWAHDAWVIVWADGEEDIACTADDCELTLSLARLTDEGAVLTPPRALWPSQPVLDRPVLVATDAGAVVAVIADDEGTPRATVGRLDTEGSPIGSMGIVMPDQNARGMVPAAAAAGNRVVIVTSVVSGGLYAAAIQADDGVRVAGPAEVIADRSASAPALGSNGAELGLAYLASSGSGSAVRFIRLSTGLVPTGDSAEVSGGAVYPRAPVVEASGTSWVTAWLDGRNDDASDCRTMSFCRNDIFLASITGGRPDGAPLEVSDDPHDCTSASVVALDGSWAVAWRTIREDRPTAFGRIVACD